MFSGASFAWVEAPNGFFLGHRVNALERGHHLLQLGWRMKRGSQRGLDRGASDAATPRSKDAKVGAAILDGGLRIELANRGDHHPRLRAGLEHWAYQVIFLHQGAAVIHLN